MTPPLISLHLANVVLQRLDLAMRQLERTQLALNDDRRMRESMGFTAGWVPVEIIATTREVEDAGHFLILALRQAVRGHYVLEKAGVALPPIRDQEKVRHLRDIHEHWDQWSIDAYEITDQPWLLADAGKRWAKVSESRPEGGMGWRHEPDGSITLTSFRGLELAALVEDLQSFRQVVQELETDAREYELPTVAAAAALVGGGRLTAVRTFTTVQGRADAEGIHRFDRDDLLEAVRMVESMPGLRFSEDHPDEDPWGGKGDSPPGSPGPPHGY